MIKIDKNNIDEFRNYYHEFHDSYFCSFNYDIDCNKIEICFDICWSGEPKLVDDKYYDTNKTKLKMIFNKIYKLNVKEIYSYLYINNIYFKYIMLDGKEKICFADDNVLPSLYIVCEDVEYEIIN